MSLNAVAKWAGRGTLKTFGMYAGLEKKVATKIARETAAKGKIASDKVEAYVESLVKQMQAGKMTDPLKAHLPGEYKQALQKAVTNRGHGVLNAGASFPFAIGPVAGLAGTSVLGQRISEGDDFERDMEAMRAMQALDMSKKMKMKRIHESQQANLIKASQHAPHLVAQIAAGRELVEGEQVIGGQPRHDLLQALTEQMSTSTFQDPYEAML